jgi:O-acetylhomoserine (thiol)-lyase
VNKRLPRTEEDGDEIVAASTLYGGTYTTPSSTSACAGWVSTPSFGGVIVDGGRFPWDQGPFPQLLEPSKGDNGIRSYET